MHERTVSLAEAKRSLTKLLTTVASRGESILIERRGEPLARLVPVARRRRRNLANVRGWLDDSDPFFAEIDAIVRERHARRPRSTPLPRAHR